MGPPKRKVHKKKAIKKSENVQKAAVFTTPDKNGQPLLPGHNFNKPPRPRSPFVDVGAPGLQVFGGWIFEEFLTELQGRRGVQVYDEMRKNDPVVGAMLFVAEQLIHNANLIVTSPDDSPEALKAKMLVETSFQDLDKSWPDTLSEILTMLPFGWAYCNVVHKKREGFTRHPSKSSKHDDGMIGWSKISLRGQDTFNGWVLGKNGEILGMQQLPPPTFKLTTVPISNAALFRTRAEKNNPEGYSILRNAWRPWFIKKNLEEVEAIGVERDLAGLPMLTTPEGLDIWNPNDTDAAATLQRAEEIVRLVRFDKYHGLVLPFGWEFKLQTTAGQRPHNTSDIISRWDQRIAVTLLADMLLIGHERVGSFALVQSKTKLFSSALESYAARVAWVFNSQLIPRMMQLNGIPQKLWPVINFGPVETPALKDLGDYVKSISDVGVNIDEAIGQYLRQVGSLPPAREGEDVLKPKEEMMPQLPFGQAPPGAPKSPGQKDPKKPKVEEA